MTTGARHVWEIPSDEFIGVPYVFAGGDHPLRNETVATLGRLNTYKHSEPAEHRFLPDGFKAAHMDDHTGFVLLDPTGAACGIYHSRMQGYLLRIHAKQSGRGLGYQFLATCLDLQDEKTGHCVWHPGTYSSQGLRASMRAHRLILNDAIARNLPVPDSAIQKLLWEPEIISGRPLDRDDVTAIARVAPADTGYKEAMAALWLLSGGTGRFEALYDKNDHNPRPYTFVLRLDGDVYQGFNRDTTENVVADILADYGLDHEPDRLIFAKTDFSSICDTKTFDREAATNLLRTVVEESGLDFARERYATGVRRAMRRKKQFSRHGRTLCDELPTRAPLC
jgi:hypothetical protein